MSANIALFAQVIRLIPREIVKKVIKEYNTDRHAKGFNSWSHLVSMVFCQFADCTSLREISNGLRSATGNLNHLGIERAPSKSNLSYQNEHRSCEMFRECYYRLFQYFGQQTDFRVNRTRLKAPIRILDSTLMSLTLSVFDWAHYTHKKGAVKLHTLLDFGTFLPEYVHITDGKGADNTSAWQVKVPAGALVIADRAYCDMKLLADWDSRGINFVVRQKTNLLSIPIAERDLPPIRHQDLLLDETILLAGVETQKEYPKPLRRIVVFNSTSQSPIVILTNNFKLAASTISTLYKARWEIEKFFRLLKQNFYIKSFVGTTRNAVEIQVWTALITIMLLAFLKQQAKYPWHFSNLVSSLRLNTFTKIDLYEWINAPFTPPPDESSPESPPDLPKNV